VEDRELEEVLAELDLSALWGRSVMVTGAAGMLGSCVVDLLRQYGRCRVIAVGRDAASGEARFGPAIPSCVFLGHDVCRPMPETGETADYIIHAASNADPVRMSQDPVGTLLSNVQGTKNLLDYGLSHGMRRFLFVSSGEVYGQPNVNLDGFTEDYCGPLDLSSPRSCYPEGKRAAEVLRAVEACGEKNLPAGVEIRDATEVVEISDDPAIAFKVKKDSSLTVGLNLLKNGEGDAFVSAGSTGALLAGATLLVKRIRGIRRAAMGPVIPTAGGRAILCDCGANAECTAEYLLQFAYLGSYYASRVLGVERPRVALLNIGAEEEKGDALRHEAYALLKEAGDAERINFTGNIEADEAMLGGADVIVADGYTGNIMLKSVEGVGKFLLKELKKMFLSGTRTKVAAALVKGDMGRMKKLVDPSEVGGTPFLGISKPVVKAHGSSDARAVTNAILRAVEYAESGFIADIENNISLMKVERNTEKN